MASSENDVDTLVRQSDDLMCQYKESDRSGVRAIKDKNDGDIKSFESDTENEYSNFLS